jgi:predicted DNA-binding transcriptional regulator AlpA
MRQVPRKPERIVLFGELPAYTGLQKSQLEVLIKAGEFPKPIKLSARRRAVLERELCEWQAARIEGKPWRARV